VRNDIPLAPFVWYKIFVVEKYFKEKMETVYKLENCRKNIL
jgi:hypothetical protein